MRSTLVLVLFRSTRFFLSVLSVIFATAARFTIRDQLSGTILYPTHPVVTQSYTRKLCVFTLRVVCTWRRTTLICPNSIECSRAHIFTRFCSAIRRFLRFIIRWVTWLCCLFNALQHQMTSCGVYCTKWMFCLRFSLILHAYFVCSFFAAERIKTKERMNKKFQAWLLIQGSSFIVCTRH